MQALIYQIDPEIRSPASRLADETLTQDARLLKKLIGASRDLSEAPATPEEQQYREQMWDQIAEYGERAGLGLKARYANAEALKYLTLAASALAGLPDSRERSQRELDIRRACDELYDLSADRTRQAKNLRRAEQLAKKLGDPAIQAEMLARRAWLAMGQGNCPQAIALLERMLRLCQEERDTCGPEEALAYRLLGIAYDKTDDVQAALRHHTQALALDEAQNDNQGTCVDLNNVANNLIIMGNFSAALSKLERAVALTTSDTAPTVKVLIAGNIGNAWVKLGQFATGAEYLREAMDLARKIGDREAECWLGAKLATLYQRRSERDRALRMAHYYYHPAMEIGARRMVELAELLAALYCEDHDGNNALAWADQAAEVAQTNGLRRFQLRSAMRRTQAYLLLDETAQAFDCAQQAAYMFERLGHPLEEEAELFWIYAQSAQVVGQETLAASAYHRAQTALLNMADLIADAKLREGFLAHHPLRSWKQAADNSPLRGAVRTT